MEWKIRNDDIQVFEYLDVEMDSYRRWCPHVALADRHWLSPSLMVQQESFSGRRNPAEYKNHLYVRLLSSSSGITNNGGFTRA